MKSSMLGGTCTSSVYPINFSMLQSTVYCRASYNFSRATMSVMKKVLKESNFTLAVKLQLRSTQFCGKVFKKSIFI